jgi:2'-5' RNA ligase
MIECFFGITLPDDFTEEVETIRRRFAAPRTAPHITLIPPFRWNRPETELERLVTSSIQGCLPFAVRTKGLGRFGQAVIFIDVVLSSELTELYERLKEGLRQEGIGDLAKGRPYHPHITLATRLSPGEFNRYMEELADYSPIREFLCHEVALFRMHTEGRFRRWQVARQLPLGS